MSSRSYNSILVTGGCGFIGSHFIEKFSELHPKSIIVNIDKLGYSVSTKTIQRLSKINNCSFYEIDISNHVDLKELFQKHSFDAIFHFAAESHVDNSIASPYEFIGSNIIGTFNLLECIRHAQELNQDIFLHHISTDEVYGALSHQDAAFTEEHKYLPSSPYSASKASSDLLVEAWSNTYKINYLITNCSNNFGPRQNSEKLIPKIIFNALNNLDIPIYGSGENIRDWLYVEDHVDAILSLHAKGSKNTIFNIGGGFEISNIDLTHLILQILEDSHNYSGLFGLIKFVEDRKGHDFRYAINSSKLMIETGWAPKNPFQENLSHTIDWYIKNLSWWDQ